MLPLNESAVENATLSWFGELGYAVEHGPDIAPGEAAAERDSFGDVVLAGRLREAIDRLNPDIPQEAREEALRKVLRAESPSLVGNNRKFHQMLRDGVEVEYKRDDGSIAGDRVRLVDFDDADNNDWLAVNQFTVIEGQHNRRPDIVVFVNGLPLAVIELKNAADEDATIWTAWNQIQTYKLQIPSLFHFNELSIVSDGLQARIGSLTANTEWFKVWRTVDGESDAPSSLLELEVLIRGVFDKTRFLQLLQHFIVFEEDTDSDQDPQDHRRLPSIPRRQPGGRDDGRGVTARGRPAVRRRVAHAGLGKELFDAVLRRADHSAPGDEQSHAGRADGPERSGRPALRPVSALPRTAAAEAGPGRGYSASA